MSVESALRNRLRNDSAVAAIVSERIFRNVAPPDQSLPYIAISRISTDRTRHQGGASGLASVVMQVSCYSATDSEVFSLADAVREAMDTFKGAMGDEALDVDYVELMNEVDAPVPPVRGEGLGTYGKHLEFRIWHAESVPTF